MQHTRDTVVGVIGAGAMGAPMVQRLLTAGPVVVAGRTRKPDLEAAGAAWAQTPRELAMRAGTVLSMLPDLPQLDEALHGPDGLLAGLHASQSLLLLIGSTSSATGVRELADRLESETHGHVRIVDAPVSGGVDGATAGTLSIMLGGEAGDVACASSALAPCGTPVHLGPLGAGQVAKACNQLVVAATITALGEASVLAERSGIDLAQLWSLLGGGYAGSNLLESRKDKLVSGDDSPSGIARYMIKDLGFAADAAEATDTRAALLPTLQSFFAEIDERGYGDRDIAVTRRVVAER